LNIKELSYLLQNPARLNKEQANSLEKITRAFPYFQSARSLVLKSLKDQESFRYNQELKTTAAYTTDRSVLFDFITSDLFKESNVSKEVKKKHKSEIKVIDPEEIKTLPRMAMDDAVRMKMKEAEDVLDPTLFSERKESSTLKQIEIAESAIPDVTEKDQPKNTQDKNKTPEETLQIDKPLDFNKKETHSFAEWLKLTSLNPIDRDSNQEIKTPIPKIEEKKPIKSLDQKHKFDLIDEFISNNPKIQPAAKNTPARNLAKGNLVPSDELMTETLARVYLVQKNYKKAIQAYNILILKNPEKSGFFADQIRAIKKLQENK
jgi:hypothetical protein